MSEVTNDQRARWAFLCLHRFMEITGCDLQDATCDLLGDLMHWAHQNGIEFDHELDRGRGHFEVELLEERGVAPGEGGDQ
jgi:hypothetical protein